jgi:hypothetical protein
MSSNAKTLGRAKPSVRQRLQQARSRLATWLESRQAHVLVIIIVCTDLLVVITDITLLAAFPDEHESPKAGVRVLLLFPSCPVPWHSMLMLGRP